MFYVHKSDKGSGPIAQIEQYEKLLTGNTVSASIPIALKDSLDQGLVKQGSRVLLIGFGVGLS